ncbi:hypothetical protein [uncultured Tenacibaculum sp.]|uniref:hypothetical protein n=1 Tax=uncultured Tenacibaculum sp. TaxID=174713 RepID=UPI002630334C|nr:hypothetical protein [uncultured Tenacibaculum sp.]
MKTRNSKREEKTIQGGGCCGTAPAKVATVQNTCGTPLQVNEKPQAGGGCC